MNDHEDTNGSKESFREQDIYLPIANVARIMKNAIPQTGKVMRGRHFTRLAFSRGEGNVNCMNMYIQFLYIVSYCFQSFSLSFSLSVLHP